MKRVRSLLTLGAFVVAAFAAFAFKPRTIGQIQAEYTIQNVCQPTRLLTNETNCNPTLTSGTQCTVTDDFGNIDPAFKNDGSTCANILFHP